MPDCNQHPKGLPAVGHYKNGVRIPLLSLFSMVSFGIMATDGKTCHGNRGKKGRVLMANNSRKDSKGRRLRDGETERRDGRYVYRYTDRASGRRQSIYAKGLAELRDKEKALTLDLHRNLQTSGTAKKMTVNALFEQHLKTLEVSPSTIVGYRSTWDSLIKDSIGNYKAVQLLPSDIKSFYAMLAKKGYAHSTIKRAHNLLHPVLETAVNDGIIHRNPTKGAMNAKYGRAEMEKQALTVEQQEKLLGFVKQDSRYNVYHPMLVIMLGTGVRCGELAGLTWDDIDMAGRKISISHQLIYKNYGDGCKLHAGKPKTGSGIRTIPMSESVWNAFREQKELNDLLGKNGTAEIEGYTDFIFITRNGNPLLPSSVNKVLYHIVDAYNSTQADSGKMPRISAHTMRHTFCTRMAENGMDVKVLQYIMGHANVSITMQIYTHIADKKRIEDEINRFDFFSVE